MNKKTIKDLDVFNKRVLLRVDFNVPIKNGVITNNNRIVQELPTIKHLLDAGACLVIMSHLGRPEGEVNLKYSLKPVATELSKLLGREVKFADTCVGAKTIKQTKELNSGEVLLLENLRFFKEEEANTKTFCEKLSKLGDLYVNDAFGTAHRKHASTYGVAEILKNNAVGYLIQKELEMIEDVINNPVKPFVGILGGSKVSDKLSTVESLINKVDKLIIGGAMAYTFLLAQGYEVGTSLVETEMVKDAKKLLELAKKKGVELLLPIDHVCADAIENTKKVVNTKTPNIPNGFMGLDIGKQTIKLFSKTIKSAKTVIWNGPVGVFENKLFENGTKQIAKALSKTRATTVVGGGDSAAAVIKFGYAKKITHVSTGGGASLKLFQGKVLPAVDVIKSV